MEGMNTSGRKLVASKLYEVSEQAVAFDKFVFFPFSPFHRYLNLLPASVSRASPFRSTPMRSSKKWMKVSGGSYCPFSFYPPTPSPPCISLVPLPVPEQVMVMLACGPYPL